jgi:hypothetical protein
MCELTPMRSVVCSTVQKFAEPVTVFKSDTVTVTVTVTVQY